MKECTVEVVQRTLLRMFNFFLAASVLGLTSDAATELTFGYLTVIVKM